MSRSAAVVICLTSFLLVPYMVVIHHTGHQSPAPPIGYDQIRPALDDGAALRQALTENDTFPVGLNNLDVLSRIKVLKNFIKHRGKSETETVEGRSEKWQESDDEDGAAKAGNTDRKSRKRKRLPQALLIGQKKCGTGAFKRFLQLHQHVQSVTRELHFFDRNKSYSRGLDFYRQQMPVSWPRQITVEGSPRYFYTPYVPGRVSAMNESILLMLILCDPTERLVSEYTHLKSNEGTARRLARTGAGAAESVAAAASFHEPQSIDLVRQFGWYPSFSQVVFTSNGTVNSAYQAVTNGIYVRHLRHWLRHFPLTQIHIINATDFLQRPWRELNRAAEFMQLQPTFSREDFYFNSDKKFYCQQKEGRGCLSKAKGREHPSVSDEQLEKIREFYRPYNEELYDLLGKNFWW